MTTADERALIERAQASAAGFGELFDAYYDRIYAYAYRRVGSVATAEDIAATVFEDALRAIKRCRWQNKPLSAWLHRIAARRVADFYRRARGDADVGLVLSTREDDPASIVEHAEDFARLRRGLEKLEAKDREIIQWTFFDDLSGAEVAALLGCTPNNAYVRLHRALKRLREILENEASYG
jgi:RNA polymerase sigma-70 factor (ECF subfamily)